MARVKQTVKTRKKKNDNNYHKCPSCNGTGKKKNVGRYIK